MQVNQQSRPPHIQNEFDAMYEQLTPRNKEILWHFLKGHEDKEIAKMIFGTKANVRFHLSKVCGTFGLKEEGVRSSHRKDLVDLFMQYRPDLVSPKRAGEGGYQPKPAMPDIPGRPMKLDSPFYLQPSLADLCCEEVLRSGSLIRIKAPQLFGKTSLLYRVLNFAQKEGYKTISLNLRYDLDESAMGSLATFLAWFCQEIATCLDLPIGNLPTTKADCHRYFLNQFLAQVDTPLVVALDEVEVLFEYPAIAKDFFSLLRGWHEKAKSPGVGALFEKLRLIIVHSTDDYIQLPLQESPLQNVGHIASLQPLALEQVESLAGCYGLQRQMEDVIEPLARLVGGHPYLIQRGLYALKCGDMSGEDVLRNSFTSSGIYRGHFQDLLVKLESTVGQSANLVEALRRMLQDPENAKLSPAEVFKLEGLGLVRTQDNQVRISCELYQRYFQAWL